MAPVPVTATARGANGTFGSRIAQWSTAAQNDPHGRATIGCAGAPVGNMSGAGIALDKIYPVPAQRHQLGVRGTTHPRDTPVRGPSRTYPIAKVLVTRRVRLGGGWGFGWCAANELNPQRAAPYHHFGAPLHRLSSALDRAIATVMRASAHRILAPIILTVRSVALPRCCRTSKQAMCPT